MSDIINNREKPASQGIRLPSISTITQFPLYQVNHQSNTTQNESDSISPRFLPPISFRPSSNDSDSESQDIFDTRSSRFSSTFNKDMNLENSRRVSKLVEYTRDARSSPSSSISSRRPSIIDSNQLPIQQHSQLLPQAQISSPISYPVSHIQVGYHPSPLQQQPMYHPQQYYMPSHPQPFPVYQPALVQSYVPQPSYTSYPAKASSPKLTCQRCGITETPEWRRGPGGARTLCNACGLFHAKLVKKKGAEAAAEEISKRKVRTRSGRRVLIQSQPNSPSKKKNSIKNINDKQFVQLQNHILDHQMQTQATHPNQLTSVLPFSIASHGQYPTSHY